MSNKPSKVSVVIVGLGFGEAFLPIYQAHPGVDRVGICEIDPEALARVGKRYGISDRFQSLENVLADSSFHAVHLATPVPLHGAQTVATLDAGKHCACAVPMATSIEDLDRIVKMEERSGKVYMMMETGVYTREFIYVKDMERRGDLGKLTFCRGSYFQDLEGSYPRYWFSLPPMHYSTHVVGPILALADTTAVEVACFGSGVLKASIQQPEGNKFPLQTATFRLAKDNLAAEVTRAWFQTARGYTEAFSAYGEKAGFEWQQIESESPVVFTLETYDPIKRGRGTTVERVKPSFRPDLLPQELANFANGDHGGSHPHLVHEFISSILELRASAIDSRTAANWTAPGICANDSSLQGGTLQPIPQFTLR